MEAAQAANIPGPVMSLPVAPTPAREVEDTLLKKVATVVPILGGFAQVEFEGGIKKKFDQVDPESSERRVKLIELKNQFKIIGLVRNLAILATLVSLYALSILTFGVFPGILLVAITLGLISGATDVYRNERAIEDIRSGKNTVVIR